MAGERKFSRCFFTKGKIIVIGTKGKIIVIGMHIIYSNV